MAQDRKGANWFDLANAYRTRPVKPRKRTWPVDGCVSYHEVTSNTVHWRNRSSIHDSPNYGKYYTTEQINEIFAPAKASVDSVIDWLTTHNINGISLSANKQWLQFDAPVEVAEKLFKTDYHVYEHAVSGGKNVACDESVVLRSNLSHWLTLTHLRYHVPEHLSEHIDYITPGIKLFSPARSGHAVNDKNTIEKRTFGVTNGKATKQPPLLKALPMAISELLGLAELSICQIAITPSCIAKLYNITQATHAQPGNELGIFEDLGDVYSQTDLNEFFLTLAQ
jgi:tripeptidyl-peptidase-1